MSFGPSPFCGEHSLRVLSQPDQSQFEHLFSSSLILLLSYAQKCFLLLLSLFFLKEWIEESLISNCSVVFFPCVMFHGPLGIHSPWAVLCNAMALLIAQPLPHLHPWRCDTALPAMGGKKGGSPPGWALQVSLSSPLQG